MTGELERLSTENLAMRAEKVEIEKRLKDVENQVNKDEI